MDRKTQIYLGTTLQKELMRSCVDLSELIYALSKKKK